MLAAVKNWGRCINMLMQRDDKIYLSEVHTSNAQIHMLYHTHYVDAQKQATGASLQGTLQ